MLATYLAWFALLVSSSAMYLARFALFTAYWLCLLALFVVFNKEYSLFQGLGGCLVTMMLPWRPRSGAPYTVPSPGAVHFAQQDEDSRCSSGGREDIGAELQPRALMNFCKAGRTGIRWRPGGRLVAWSGAPSTAQPVTVFFLFSCNPY